MKTFYQVRYLRTKKGISAGYAIFEKLEDAKKFLSADLKKYDILQDCMTVHNLKNQLKIELWNRYVSATNKKNFMEEIR